MFFSSNWLCPFWGFFFRFFLEKRVEGRCVYIYILGQVGNQSFGGPFKQSQNIRFMMISSSTACLHLQFSWFSLGLVLDANFCLPLYHFSNMPWQEKQSHSAFFEREFFSFSPSIFAADRRSRVFKACFATKKTIPSGCPGAILQCVQSHSHQLGCLSVPWKGWWVTEVFQFHVFC